MRIRLAGIAEALAVKEYLRERLEPRPGDPLYLHLSDLLVAIKGLVPSHALRVLDYGCGGSPYRPLFGECVYQRADFLGGANLDFEYSADSHLPPEAADYDCVLSTQVLEHVEKPASYLKECSRVLRPGGYSRPMVLSRTAQRLRRAIERAGLKVKSLKKLTTGPRAVLFLSEREFHRLRFGAAGMYGTLLSLGVRAVQSLGARRLHLASDQSFAQHRVVDASEPGHDIIHMHRCVGMA